MLNDLRRWSAGRLAAEHGSEQLPGVALEAHQLLLLDRIKVRRTCVDLDTGQQDAWFEVLEVCSLPRSKTAPRSNEVQLAFSISLLVVSNRDSSRTSTLL